MPSKGWAATIVFESRFRVCRANLGPAILGEVPTKLLCPALRAWVTFVSAAILVGPGQRKDSGGMLLSNYMVKFK